MTALRRQAVPPDEVEPSILSRQFGRQPLSLPSRAKRKSRLSGAEIGEAYHLFLQHFSIAAAPDSLKAEAERLWKEGVLSEPQLRVLDVRSLATFWSSYPGAAIRAAAEYLRRELPFTARFTPGEVSRLCDLPPEPTLEREMMIVQGVIDLAVIWPESIWIVDFKSDEVGGRTIDEKARSYAPQLRLYSAALGKIYQRPVVKCWIHFLSPGRTIAIGGDTQLELGL